MSEPFLAEIRIVGFNFAPRGWAFCDGQVLPINQNQSLFSLLGTTYGGDGRTSFALPDLRGRTPIHVGSSNGTLHDLGDRGGEEAHALAAAEMPTHKHSLEASTDLATQGGPGGNFLSTTSLAGGNIYSRTTDATDVSLATSAIARAGGGQAHNNVQPTTVLNFCIALQGLFPSRN